MNKPANGTVTFMLVLLLLLGGGAYYFRKEVKQKVSDWKDSRVRESAIAVNETSTPTPAVATTATPTPAATATPKSIANVDQKNVSSSTTAVKSGTSTTASKSLATSEDYETNGVGGSSTKTSLPTSGPAEIAILGVAIAGIGGATTRYLKIKSQYKNNLRNINIV